MPKSSIVSLSLPEVAASALRKLGENISLARARRKESQRQWAQRIGISVPTLIRLEKGDPTVSMGAYASALWLMGRVQALAEVADPQFDFAALEVDLREAKRRKAVRSPHSIRQRLQKAPNR
jgi:DNA-binding XRE family transcriptional regulator